MNVTKDFYIKFLPPIANKCFACYSIDLMGDIQRDRLLGPRELLAIAITEREIFNIRELFRERHFYRKVNLIGKSFVFLLAMCLVSEINALRLTTVILLVILVALSFYLIVQSWNRCEALTVRLNQEVFRNLMAASDDEE